MTLTPEQFNKITTKEEFHELKKEMLEVKGDVKKILTAVDGLAKSVKDFKTEMASNRGAHDRMSDNINDHEIKLKKLELKKGFARKSEA